MADARHPTRRRRRADALAIGDGLRRFRRGGGAATAGDAGMAAEWLAAVGPAVVANARPIRRTRAGVVTVACSSAAWAQELTARRDQILPALARAVPGLTALRFVVADQVFADGAAREAPAPSPPSPQERAAGERAAAGVSDPTLRALIARAAAASLARDRGSDPSFPSKYLQKGDKSGRADGPG